MMLEHVYYTFTPLSPSEARALLQISRTAYEDYLADGILQRSIDLSDERPGCFLAHSFFDVARLKLFIEFREHMVGPKDVLLGYLDRMLDEFASALDCNLIQQEGPREFENALARFFDEHIIGLFQQDQEEKAFKRFLELWKQLEVKVSRCFFVTPELPRVLFFSSG